MQQKKAFFRIAGSLLGVMAIGSLSSSKLSAQTTVKAKTQVEILAPSQPFQAALQVQGRGVGFSVGPAQGTLAVTSLVVTNNDTVEEFVVIFQSTAPGACGNGAFSDRPDLFNMTVWVQPHQTLSLPFPSPAVFTPINGQTCIGIAGGTDANLVKVQVTGFVN